MEPTYDSTKHPPEAGLVSRDVTERAERERELRELKGELESAFEHAAIAKAIVGLDGSWLKVNRALCDLTGYSQEELLAISFQEITHPDDLDADLAHLERLVAGEIESYRMEKRYLRRDGSVVPVLLSVSALRGDDGRPLRFISQIQDWTNEIQRRELERELFERRRLDSLGTLAGGVAHDFNNLLQGILGHTALAVAALPEGSPALARLESVELAATRAAELTAQMLAYSGQRGLELGGVDVSTIARDAFALLPPALSVDADVTWRLADGPLLVRGDAAQLERVPVNLLANAIEAGGKLVVSTGAEEGGVYLEVADDGEGMDADVQARMFEPFFTTRFPGRGLGLAAVEGVVRSHGGEILVDSAPGRGTTVRLLLPAA